MTIANNDCTSELGLCGTIWDSNHNQRQHLTRTNLETGNTTTLLAPSYHVRRQKRRKLSAYRNGHKGLLGRTLTTTNHRRRRSSNPESHQYIDEGIKQVGTTYKLRFMHQTNTSLREKAEDNENCMTHEESRPNRVPTYPKTTAEMECSGNTKNVILDIGEENRTVASGTSWAMVTNLPRLPEMQGSFTKSSAGKTIHNLNGSRSSSWILVGPHGNHHLRQPTPIPPESFHTLTKPLPPIHEQDRGAITKSNDWGLKNNKVTLSALLQVDHKQACLRDRSLEFGKELMLQSRFEPITTSKTPAEKVALVQADDAEEEPRKDHRYLVEEGERRGTPVIILPPLPPFEKRQGSTYGKGHTNSVAKPRSLPRLNSRSTLPEPLPQLCIESDDKSAIDSSFDSDESDYSCSSCSSDEDESGGSSQCASSSPDRSWEERTLCVDPISTGRSDSEIRERLVDIMDFECQSDLACTFEDDKTLQRAVVLRNHAFHPQTPPPSPNQELERSRCDCLVDPATMKSSNQLSEGLPYSDSSPKSFTDKLRPTLQVLERLIDSNFTSVKDDADSVEPRLAYDSNDSKPGKSVRFADLPKKRKPISRSTSDPTSGGGKTTSHSAEWNECFLVAVGQNRAIKTETRRRHRSCKPDLLNENEDNDDELGAELIAREMKRYVHWLRHDRAVEQRRWFSNSTSHKNLPMTTHHMPQPVFAGNPQLSTTSLSSKVAKAIGLYSVLPQNEPEGPPFISRPVRFPKIPVLPPIAGGSNEVLLSRTFTGEVTGLPVVSKERRGRNYDHMNIDDRHFYRKKNH